jgi:hypothetical protein
MCTGSIPSAGSPLALPLGQQLVQATPRVQPQSSNSTNPASAPTASNDPNRGKHVNIAA